TFPGLPCPGGTISGDAAAEITPGLIGCSALRAGFGGRQCPLEEIFGNFFLGGASAMSGETTFGACFGGSHPARGGAYAGCCFSRPAGRVSRARRPPDRGRGVPPGRALRTRAVPW